MARRDFLKMRKATVSLQCFARQRIAKRTLAELKEAMRPPLKADELAAK